MADYCGVEGGGISLEILSALRNVESFLRVVVRVKKIWIFVVHIIDYALT